MKNFNFFPFSDEIKENKSLRILGIGLALTHILTFFYWFFGPLPGKLISEQVRICWVFNQSCDEFNLLTSGNLKFIFYFYFVLALFTILAYLNKKTCDLANILLTVITLIKVSLFIQDYRFMGNYHYMPFWMTATYLFSPRKKEACALLLVLFYFGAGLLKFNVEWLSGAAMIRPPIIAGKVLEWANAFVILLEMFFVFWIFSKHFWKRSAALALLVTFHFFSWHIVGYFYPLIMFSLLLFIGFNLKLGIKLNWRTPSFVIFPSLFMICQLIPFIFFPKSAVTGEGRILSLNMFDAKTICQPEIIYHRNNSFIELPTLLDDLGVRLGCDPIVHYAQAKWYCKNISPVYPDKISLHLASKTSTGRDATQTLKINDVCHNPPKINFWGEFL